MDKPSQLYLVPIILAILLCAFVLSTLKVRKRVIVMDKPFLNNFANDVYAVSFASPFVWFINPDLEDDKVKSTNHLIAEAGLMRLMDYRVFSVLQTTLMFIGFGLTFCFLLFWEPATAVFKFLFNVELNAGGDPTQTKLLLACGFMSLSVLPRIWLKQRAKKHRFAFLQDLPMLQLFVVQMLRANNPVGQMLYLMSKVHTRYRDIFSVGYRIFSRNNEEGLQYLRGCFKNTGFEETIIVLQDFNNYSREESLRVLDNVTDDLNEAVKSAKKTKAIAGNLSAQLVLVIPFAAVILLAFVPLVIFGTSMMQQAQNL